MIQKSNSSVAWTLMILLAIIWGSSFMLMKRGLDVYTPFQIGALRMFVSFLCLTPFLLSSIRKVPKRKWKFLAAAGWLGNGIPSILFPFAETQLSSALTGMLNSLTPLFTFIVGISFFRMRFTQNRIYGLIIGLIGASLLVAGKGSDGGEGDLLFAGAVMVATVCYGVSVNIIKSKLYDLDSITNTTIVLLFVGIPMGVALFFTDFVHRTLNEERAMVSLAYVVVLGVMGTAFSTVLFNRLIKISGALFASSVTYLIPIVAMIWGLADQEHLLPIHFLGLAGALIGVYLINKSTTVTAQKNT